MADYSIKSIRQDFKNKGIFYTPEKLSKFMRNLLPAEVDEIYDPTCGAGNLLSVFGDEVKKYGQDINSEQVEFAKTRLKNFEGIAGDTLKSPAFKGKKFNYIIANYPFSIKWEPFVDERFEKCPVLPPPSKADYAFILHILHYLSDNGKAAVMGFPGILYRGGREQKIRKWIVDQNYIEKIIHIPGNKFTDTAISTIVIVFNKNKTNSDIVFVDDENGLERTVKITEIQENNYCLSVQNYVQKEEIKEKINPLELMKETRNIFYNHLRKELEFEKAICLLNNGNFYEFVDELQIILNQYKQGKEVNKYGR